MAIPVFHHIPRIPFIPKCACCGAPADYHSSIMPIVNEKICQWCAREINPGIIFLALGHGCAGAVNIEGGTYDVTTWHLFPKLIQRIDSLKNQEVKPETDQSKFPHRCPSCGSPAYIGLLSVECSNGSCH
jgi:hypothetical protein